MRQSAMRFTSLNPHANPTHRCYHLCYIKENGGPKNLGGLSKVTQPVNDEAKEWRKRKLKSCSRDTDLPCVHPISWYLLHNSQGPEQNKNVRPLVEKLLSVSRWGQQSMETRARASGLQGRLYAHAAGPASCPPSLQTQHGSPILEPLQSCCKTLLWRVDRRHLLAPYISQPGASRKGSSHTPTGTGMCPKLHPMTHHLWAGCTLFSVSDIKSKPQPPSFLPKHLSSPCILTSLPHKVNWRMLFPYVGVSQLPPHTAPPPLLRGLHSAFGGVNHDLATPLPAEINAVFKRKPTSPHILN